MRKKTLILGVTACAAIIAAGLFFYQKTNKEVVPTDFTVSYEGIKTGKIDAGVSVHDPSIIKAEGKYYIFGSHMVGGVSEDLRTWQGLGNGYSIRNPIYGELLKNEEAFAYAGNKKSLIPTDDRSVHVWAPDAIYNDVTGLYYMYFCTTSTWNESNLCYATSETIEGPYEWQGALIYSGYSKGQLKDTDVLDYVTEDYAKRTYFAGTDYNVQLYPNAIDPTVFYDEEDRMWMVYGSWSGGIFLLEIDKSTGEVIHPEADPEHNVDPYYGKRLLGGGHKSIEGPYIQYDPVSGYYYLYVSYGALTREGGYQIRVFRSETVDGDYVDMNGNAPIFSDTDHSGFGLKLSGNYYLPSLEMAYMATGHNSAFTDDDGKNYIVYHTRFDNGTENHEPRVHQMLVNEEGWPCMLPYATEGETVAQEGYDLEEITGDYYVINQGTGINAEIAEPVKWTLTKKGNIYGENLTGTFEEREGSYYIHLDVGDASYSGVLCRMNDEAGTSVMVFSAVGNNESIWGVKY